MTGRRSSDRLQRTDTIEAMGTYDPAYYQRNKDRIREQRRAYREKHREEYNARRRAWYARSPGQREYQTAWMRENGPRLRHGAEIEDWKAATWTTQEGRCYLCRDPLQADDMVIEHDHRCHPQLRSCADCRRGLACGRCNRLIGMVADDPVLLRRIATNLESKMT